jgi:hypothetical protein
MDCAEGENIQQAVGEACSRGIGVACFREIVPVLHGSPSSSVWVRTMDTAKTPNLKLCWEWIRVAFSLGFGCTVA